MQRLARSSQVRNPFLSVFVKNTAQGTTVPYKNKNYENNNTGRGGAVTVKKNCTAESEHENQSICLFSNKYNEKLRYADVVRLFEIVASSIFGGGAIVNYLYTMFFIYKNS